MRSGSVFGMRCACLAAAAAMIAGVGLLGCTPAEKPDPAAAAAREPAPDFTLQTLAGGDPVSLSSLRGKTVVLDFWATWCPPCEFQVPELNRFYDAHRDDSDVAVFGISIDVEGSDAIQAWASEHDVRYPILLGDEALAREFGAVGFPTLYVVAPDGTVAEQHVGLIASETLESTIAERRAGEPL